MMFDGRFSSNGLLLAKNDNDNDDEDDEEINFNPNVKMPRVVRLNVTPRSSSVQNKTKIDLCHRKKRKLNNFDADEADSHCERKVFKLDEKSNLNHRSDDGDNGGDQELNERDFWLIANVYDNLNEWRLLANALDLSEHDVQLIEAKHLQRDGLDECLYQVLIRWRLQSENPCTMRALVDLLGTKLNKTGSFLDQLTQSLSHRQLDYQQARRVLNAHAQTIPVDVKLGEKQMWRAAEIICPQWKPISRCMGLDETQIAQIESRHASTDGLRECAYQSLLLCSEFDYENFTFTSLCSVLIKLKLNFYVRKLTQRLFSD